jgi:hypothetical protein
MLTAGLEQTGPSGQYGPKHEKGVSLLPERDHDGPVCEVLLEIATFKNVTYVSGCTTNLFVFLQVKNKP